MYSVLSFEMSRFSFLLFSVWPGPGLSMWPGPGLSVWPGPELSVWPGPGPSVRPIPCPATPAAVRARCIAGRASMRRYQAVTRGRPASKVRRSSAHAACNTAEL